MSTNAADALFDDMAKQCGGIGAKAVIDLMTRHSERFSRAIRETLEREKALESKPKPVAMSSQPARKAPPAPTTVRELSERQRRQVRDLQNIAPANGAPKLTEAQAMARVLAGEKQQALALSERPTVAPIDPRVVDRAAKQLARQSGGLKTEAEAKAAIERMRARFK